MAIYAIGDIQGCYDALRELLEQIKFDPNDDTLWLVGDLVNRGPKSLKVLRYVMSLGDSAITVLGNHDLHLLALSQGVIGNGKRFETLSKTLSAPDIDEIVHWLRHRPLAHYDPGLDTLMVHAGTHPLWTIEKTMRRAAEVEKELQGPNFGEFLTHMYGNRPSQWSGKLRGDSRLRFIVNCLTRMRVMTADLRLRMAFSGPPWLASAKLTPWFDFEHDNWRDTRIVFGHWSQLGLVVLPKLLSLDSGCVWGRQLTAARIDTDDVRIYQVQG